MALVEIPAGSFLRGAAPTDPDAGDDELPAREILVPRSFWMGVHEVTQSQFERVMGTNPAWFGPQGPGRPLVGNADTSDWPLDNASWRDAVEFCRRLSDLPAEREARRRYRLPREFEWEYACRAGTTSRFAFGDQLQTSQACFGILLPEGHPQPVGSYYPNPWGLHDMHGNVWEWCADRYSPTAYADMIEDRTKETPGSTARVVRGGDWRASAPFCRSSNRDLTRESRRDVGNGFRVLCEISP